MYFLSRISKLSLVFCIIKQHIQSLACNLQGAPPSPPKMAFLTKSSRKQQRSVLAWVELEIKTKEKKIKRNKIKISRLPDRQALMQPHKALCLKESHPGKRVSEAQERPAAIAGGKGALEQRAGLGKAGSKPQRVFGKRRAARDCKGLGEYQLWS